MTRFGAADELRGAEFVDVDLSGAVFREADLTGARMHGVLLTGADLDGDITGLRINGVDVAPLVKAELDRLHPERLALRPTTPDGGVAAVDLTESLWLSIVDDAASLSEADVHRSVDGEWSFVDTLRHLVFVVDAWFGHAVLDQPDPFHPWGMPASFLNDAATVGITVEARPSLADVVDVLTGRLAGLRSYLATVTQAELDRERPPLDSPGWPPPAPRTAAACVRVIFNDAWAHLQFARRDLARLRSVH